MSFNDPFISPQLNAEDWVDLLIKMLVQESRDVENQRKQPGTGENNLETRCVTCVATSKMQAQGEKLTMG